MAQKIKAPSFVSFKGTLKWPKLHEPDFGNKEYPCPEGQFKTGLVGRSTDAEVKLLIAKLSKMHEAAIAHAEEEFKKLKIDTRKKLKQVTVNPLFTEVFDEETEEPTGEVVFNFKMPHSGVYKSGPKQGKTWKRSPAIFDAKGNLMKPVPEIWGGTIARVAFEVGINKEGQPGYFIPGTGAAGLSLRLQAVRIIDLVQGGERSASAYGFAAEEEGYEYTAPQASDNNEEEEAGSGGVEASGDDNTDF